MALLRRKSTEQEQEEDERMTSILEQTMQELAEMRREAAAFAHSVRANQRKIAETESVLTDLTTRAEQCAETHDRIAHSLDLLGEATNDALGGK